MLDRDTIKQLAGKLLDRRKALLDRLQFNTEAWNALRERPIEFEERAAGETLSMPIEGLDEQGFRELSGIDKALRKIEQGRYGICELCGQEIGAKRLQAEPEAERCLNCAAQSVPMFEKGQEE